MIQIKTKKRVVDMTLTEFAKWACLLEAYHFINQRADELGLNPINMIKPLAMEKYIDERYPAMLHDVQVEYNLGRFD